MKNIKNMSKNKKIAIAIISYLVLAFFVVYFGRIYYPENFCIDVPFIENYIILLIATCIAVLFFCLMGIAYIAMFWNIKEENEKR